MKTLFFKSLLLFSFFCFETHVIGLTTSGNEIIDEGRPIQLKGVNWFGFNNQQTMVDGLWGSDSLSSDFATVVQRMQLLGINALRLPFNFKDLFEIKPRKFTQQGKVPNFNRIIESVTPPHRFIENRNTLISAKPGHWSHQ